MRNLAIEGERKAAGFAAWTGAQKGRAIPKGETRSEE
jgi:hypothetical protein